MKWLQALHITWRGKMCFFQWIQKETTKANHTVPDWSSNLELLIHFCSDKVTRQREGEENLIGAKNKACLEYVIRHRCIQKTEQANFCKEADQTNSKVREKLKMHNSQMSAETLKPWLLKNSCLQLIYCNCLHLNVCTCKTDTFQIMSTVNVKIRLASQDMSYEDLPLQSKPRQRRERHAWNACSGQLRPPKAARP